MKHICRNAEVVEEQEVDVLIDRQRKKEIDKLNWLRDESFCVLGRTQIKSKYSCFA